MQKLLSGKSIWKSREHKCPWKCFITKGNYKFSSAVELLLVNSCLLVWKGASDCFFNYVLTIYFKILIDEQNAMIKLFNSGRTILFLKVVLYIRCTVAFSTIEQWSQKRFMTNQLWPLPTITSGAIHRVPFIVFAAVAVA